MFVNVTATADLLSSLTRARMRLFRNALLHFIYHAGRLANAASATFGLREKNTVISLTATTSFPGALVSLQSGPREPAVHPADGNMQYARQRLLCLV